MRILSRWLVLVAAGLLFAEQATAGPRVDVVVGSKASELERFAASEVAVQFKKLFDADVKISDQVTAGSDPLIVIGSPTSNSALQPLGTTWPKLTDQGHLVRSIQLGSRKAIVAGGGSPVATLWAVYELGHHFGIRYALYGDMYPGEPVELKLDGIDRLLEPSLRQRTWKIANESPIGLESWGLAEHQHAIKQLAKLKFNRVIMAFQPSQGYVDFEYKGIKSQSAMSWGGVRFPVDGDTAGRAVFRGAKFFENPDFAATKTYGERTAAATQQARGVLTAARQLGMTTGIAFSPLEFPYEFENLLTSAKAEAGAKPSVDAPGSKLKFNDPLLLDLAKTQLKAYLKTYPDVDVLCLTLPESIDWSSQAEEAWKDLDSNIGLSKFTSLKSLNAVQFTHGLSAIDGKIERLRAKLTAVAFFNRLLSDKDLFTLPTGRNVKLIVEGIDSAAFPVLDKLLPSGTETLNSLAYSVREAVAQRELIKAVPAGKVLSDLSLPLSSDSVVPQACFSSLQVLVDAVRAAGWNGFTVTCGTVGDLDFSLYYLSRASFQENLTPQQVLNDMLIPTLGASSAGRVLKAFEQVEEATHLMEQSEPGFDWPGQSMVLNFYTSSEPRPDGSIPKLSQVAQEEWLSKSEALLHSASDELYRVNTRARDGNREFSLYLARRYEFAAGYLGALATVRKAGIAKAKGDQETQLAELEKAAESLHTALNALAAVARSNSDRGVIAVLNEYGYRPLKKELEAE